MPSSILINPPFVPVFHFHWFELQLLLIGQSLRETFSSIFIFSLISLCDVLSVVVLDLEEPEPNLFYEFLYQLLRLLVLILMIPKSWPTSVGAFFRSGKATFINGPRSLPRNLISCIILDGWVLDISLISLDELFKEVLWTLATCVLTNNRCWKLFLPVPIMPDDHLRVIPVTFFVANFN